MEARFVSLFDPAASQHPVHLDDKGLEIMVDEKKLGRVCIPHPAKSKEGLADRKGLLVAPPCLVGVMP